MPLIRHLLPVLCLFAASAFAQPATQADSQLPLSEQAPFDLLLGNWKGEGWASRGPNDRSTFQQNEQIEAKAGGHVVVIEGTGRNPGTDNVDYEAFAIVAFDQAKETLTWTAYNEGNVITVVPQVTDKQIVWGFTVEGGEVRYTIDLTETTWREIGEFSPDGGKTWVPTLEMTLTKND